MEDKDLSYITNTMVTDDLAAHKNIHLYYK